MIALGYLFLRLKGYKLMALTYTDKQIDDLLEKAQEIGLIDSLRIIRTLDKEVRPKYMDGLRTSMREILELLPEPEATRTIYAVICQPWWEKEKGWGERPDGWTMHANEEDRQAFIDAYWGRMPDKVPNEYSYPDGDGFLIEVDDATYQVVCGDKRRGVWGDGTKAPQPANRRDLSLGINKL